MYRRCQPVLGLCLTGQTKGEIGSWNIAGMYDFGPQGRGVPPLKWSTNWGRFAPFFGGPGDGWETREA